MLISMNPDNILVDEVNKCAKLCGVDVTESQHPTWRIPNFSWKHFWSDMFSLGCLIFYILIKEHPFILHDGVDYLAQVYDNQKGEVDQFIDKIKHLPEAHDLISKLLNVNSPSRPSAKDVLSHPFFWNARKRMQFIRDVVERLEGNEIETNKRVIRDVTKATSEIVGENQNWLFVVEPLKSLVTVEEAGEEEADEGTHGPGVFRSLKFIHNIIVHYWEFEDVQKHLKYNYLEGTDDFFYERFPSLVVVIHRVLSSHYKSDIHFRMYFGV